MAYVNPIFSSFTDQIDTNLIFQHYFEKNTREIFVKNAKSSKFFFLIFLFLNINDRFGAFNDIITAENVGTTIPLICSFNFSKKVEFKITKKWRKLFWESTFNFYWSMFRITENLVKILTKLSFIHLFAVAYKNPFSHYSRKTKIMFKKTLWSAYTPANITRLVCLQDTIYEA